MPPDPAFDDLVRVARTLCGAPIASISLVAPDPRGSRVGTGVELETTLLHQSIRADVSSAPSLLVIADLAKDPRTEANPLVTGEPFLRFYAGAPLRSPDGAALGTLCVMDHAPRPAGLDPEKAEALEALARQASSLLAMRRAIEARESALVDERLTGNAHLGRAMASEAVGERLRGLESRLRGAQEAGRIGAFEVDLVTDRLFPSAEFCRLFGIPATSELPTEDAGALVLPQDKAFATTPASRAAGTAAVDTEYRIRRPSDGTVRWISRKSAFEPGPDGRPIRMLGVVQDVTEQKLAAFRRDALLMLGDQLRDAATLDEAVRRASLALVETLDAQRSGYASIDLGSETFTVEDDWALPGTTSLRGGYPIALFADTIEHLAAGRTLAVADVATATGLARDIGGYGRIAVRAVIKVPLMHNRRLTGALFVHSAAARVWDEAEIAFVKAVADRTHAAIAKIQAEAEQRVLNQELSHRLKNSLAMVQAIANQTLRNPADKPAVGAFKQRLATLAKAHDVLLDQNWVAARIREVVTSALTLHGDITRFEISGPNLNLGPKVVLSLSMLLHELATNAVKHGALSAEGGHVRFTWIVEHGQVPVLVLHWEELGGPPAQTPERRGFGSRLIGMGLAGTGEVNLRYLHSGLVAEFRAPLSAVTGW